MPKTISYNGLLKKELPSIEYLVEDIIPKAGIVLVCGPPGTFKTNFLLYTSILGCDGQNIFDFEVEKPFKTFWIDEENREVGMKDKIMKLKNGLELNDISNLSNNHLLISVGFQLLVRGSDELLKNIIESYKPDMIVIDSVAKVFPLSERDEKDVRRIFTQLNPLIKEFGTTFVLIHHTRKGEITRKSINLADVAGSREFGAMADSIVVIDAYKNNKYCLRQVKSRYSTKCPTINFIVSGDANKITLEYEGLAKDKFIKMEQHIAVQIREWEINSTKDEHKTKEIVDAMKLEGYKRSNILNALKILVKDGFYEHKFGVYKMKEGGMK